MRNRFPLTLRGRDDDGDVPRDPRAVLTEPVHRRLMILGSPGSGKTTLMKALASGIGQRPWPELRDAVPVYARLRSYADAGEETDLWDWLAGQLQADFGIRHAAALVDALHRDGQLPLLLDGLDEIGEAAARWLPARIVDLADRLAEGAAGPGARLMVTCREQNDDLLPDPSLFSRDGFQVLRLAEMRNAEVEAMVARREADFPAKAKSASAFLARVRAAPAIAELHRNPLLLTLSLGLYLNRAEDRDPHDLAELYDQGIENLLRRHDFATSMERGLKPKPRNTKPYRDKLALLQCFALETLRRATAEHRDFEVWPVADLIAAAPDLAGERLEIAADEAETLVAEVHRNSGLINDTGDGERFSFAHRSLQEFCAARELARRGDAGLSLALEHIDEPDWARVPIFYASLEHDGAERLVRALLERGMAGDVEEASAPAAVALDADDAVHKLTTCDADERDQSLRMPRLALAGQCAAVLTRPLTGLRQQVADALAEALAAEPVQGTPRRGLLAALIRLGRDAAEPVRQRVEQTLRHLLATDRLAAELGRLDRTTALAIIELLIDGGAPELLRAALARLHAVDGVDRVPLLWQWIGPLADRPEGWPGPADDLARAVALMTEILDDPAAVARLQAQPALLVEHFDEMSLREVYPFRRLPETNIPNGAGFSLAFKERQRAHRRALCPLPRRRRRAKRQARRYVG